MHDDNSGANTNTILIVIVLILVVAFGVWYMKGGSPKAEDTDGFKIEIGGGSEEPSGN